MPSVRKYANEARDGAPVTQRPPNIGDAEGREVIDSPARLAYIALERWAEGDLTRAESPAIEKYSRPTRAAIWALGGVAGWVGVAAIVLVA